MRPGSRVDAAFYLQINEFRGNRTVQLQMVDIRPSLTVSTREDECLAPVGALSAGRSAPAQGGGPPAAIRGSQCVQLWRALERTVPPEGLTACYLPLLRELSARLDGGRPLPSDCLLSGGVPGTGQLLTLRQEGDTISMHTHRPGETRPLGRNPVTYRACMRSVQPKRGGDHHD